MTSHINSGRDSSVGIATRYGMDGPGIKSRRGRDFPHPSIPTLGPTQPPVQWVPGLSPGVKRPGRRADNPPPSNCRGQERIELYLYSPSGPSWPVMGAPLPLPLHINSQYITTWRVILADAYVTVFRSLFVRCGVLYTVQVNAAQCCALLLLCPLCERWKPTQGRPCYVLMSWQIQ